MPRKLPVALAAVLSLTITADAAAAGYATRTLQVGSSGSDVRALQRYLDRAGYDTIADGAFGPATRRSVMSFESAEQRRVNGRASRAEQRMVRARASAAVPDEPETAPTEKAYLSSSGLAVAPDSAPDEVKAIIEAGNAIATKPYKYGGGHARWGERGRGSWVTIRTNPSHAYMIVAGLRFDTSARSRTGNRWSEQMRSASGFVARHPSGL